MHIGKEKQWEHPNGTPERQTGTHAQLSTYLHTPQFSLGVGQLWHGRKFHPSACDSFNVRREHSPKRHSTQIGNDVANGRGTHGRYAERRAKLNIDRLTGQYEYRIVHNTKPDEGDGLVQCHDVQFAMGRFEDWWSAANLLLDPSKALWAGVNSGSLGHWQFLPLCA